MAEGEQGTAFTAIHESKVSLIGCAFSDKIQCVCFRIYHKAAAEF